jgi:hypothetical protein
MSKVMKSGLLEGRGKRDRHRMMRKTQTRRGLCDGHRVGDLGSVETVPLTACGQRAVGTCGLKVFPDHNGRYPDTDHQDGDDEEHQRATHHEDAMGVTPQIERGSSAPSPRSGRWMSEGGVGRMRVNNGQKMACLASGTTNRLVRST